MRCVLVYIEHTINVCVLCQKGIMQLTRNFREMLIMHVGLYFDSSAQGHNKIVSVESCFTADLERVFYCHH